MDLEVPRGAHAPGQRDGSAQAPGGLARRHPAGADARRGAGRPGDGHTGALHPVPGGRQVGPGRLGRAARGAGGGPGAAGRLVSTELTAEASAPARADLGTPRRSRMWIPHAVRRNARTWVPRGLGLRGRVWVIQWRLAH